MRAYNRLEQALVAGYKLSLRNRADFAPPPLEVACLTEMALLNVKFCCNDFKRGVRQQMTLRIQLTHATGSVFEHLVMNMAFARMDLSAEAGEAPAVMTHEEAMQAVETCLVRSLYLHDLVRCPI